MLLRQFLARISISYFILLTGCATSYSPNGINGGYKEEKIDEQTYVVYFFGNGYTSGDTVWNYWIYRCAELTKEKGFTAFTLVSVEKKDALENSQMQYGSHKAKQNDQPKFIETKGGSAPIYIYPGPHYYHYTL